MSPLAYLAIPSNTYQDKGGWRGLESRNLFLCTMYVIMAYNNKNKKSCRTFVEKEIPERSLMNF